MATSSEIGQRGGKKQLSPISLWHMQKQTKKNTKKSKTPRRNAIILTVFHSEHN